MFQKQCEELLIKGLIRVEGRPDGIFITAQSRKHKLLAAMLTRIEKLNLAGFQAMRRVPSSPAQASRATATAN